MKRMLGFALLALGCGSPLAPRLDANGVASVAVVPSTPRFELKVDPEEQKGMSWSAARIEGAQLAIDLVATDTLVGVYGLALRLEVTGARFARADVPGEWAISRAERTTKGAVVVLSETGTNAGKQLSGRVATLWFDLKVHEEGEVRFDAAHTALFNRDGAITPVAWANARWSWQ
jgi:hypothetical protein